MTMYYANRRYAGRSSSSSMTAAVIVLVVMLFVGGVFAGIGFVIRSGINKAKEVCTVEVSAKVIDMKRGSGDDTSTPVYRYEYNGQQYTYSSSIYTNMPKYHTGDEVDIMISPDDPSVVYVPGDTNTRMFSLVFIVIGSVMIVMGVVVFAVIAAAAKKNRSEERRQEEPWLM